MSEKISVIVPIYKVEQYLEECIQSLIGQTYSNLEIILVDDGSPDGCPDICDRYAKTDNRIIVVHKENGGLSDARNAGMDVATGSWIFFVDSDDYVHKCVIEELYKAATDSDSEVSWCSIKEVSDDGMYDGQKASWDDDRWLGEYASDPEDDTYGKTFVLTKQEALDKFYSMNMKQESLVAWNKLYKRDIFDRNAHIRYPKGKIYEDGYTTYLLLYEANKVAVVRKPLYFYRQRSGSIMNVNSMRAYEPALEAGKFRMDFFREHGESELCRKETNLDMYLVIRFYGKAKGREARKYLKNWYRTYYQEYFKHQGWPMAKRIRMNAFRIGYPLYKLISSFEGTYNKMKS